MDQVIAWLVKNNINLARISATLAVLAATIVGVAALNRLLRRLLGSIESRLHVPYEHMLTTTRFVTGCLWLIAVLLVLDVWGIGFGGVWTFLASAIAVIGVGFLAVWT